MDYTALRAYIEAQPEFAAWLVAGSDQQIADAINASPVRVLGAISRAQFAVWAGSTGLRAAIQDHADTPGSPLRASALTLLDFLRGGVAESINLADPVNQAMLDAWRQAGALTAAQADALTALATHDAPRFGAPLHNLDVARAFGRMGV